MNIGRYIKKYRKNRKLSQGQLAEMSKTNTSYISHIESGKKTPSIRTLKKFSQVLKVPLQAFFGPVRSKNIPNYEPKIEEILKLLKNTDDKQKKEVKDFIKFITKRNHK